MDKRFPIDYTHEELANLVIYHHDKHIEAVTKYTDTLEKLKEVQKELSKLKRNKAQELPGASADCKSVFMSSILT